MHRVLSQFLIWICLLSAFGFQRAQAQEGVKVPQLTDLHIEEAWAILNEDGTGILASERTASHI